MKRISLLLSLLTCFLTARAAEAPLVTITARPQPAYIERGPTAQYVNFDFVVENLTDEKLTIDGIELSVLDKKGILVLRRFIDDGGTRPSIETITKRTLDPKQRVLIFNPFHTFEASVELASLRYVFSISTPAQDREYPYEVTVKPLDFTPKTSLILPVAGRQIVYDGHDFYAHHRRFDYEFAPIRQFGITTNFMRYSYDFVPVSAKGEMFTGDAKDNKSYPGFGAALRAVAAGKVVAAVSDKPDNRQFDQSQLATNPMVLFGNYLVLDHGNGEFSVYGHLQQGSLTVKVGDMVKPNQPLAKIGASGSANFPHLHYELQTGPDTRAEGLPSYFTNFTRVLGSRSVAVKQGMVDSGDILEAK